ncbi:uncharacterized protein LOC131206745 [Anopheles bellator]|uniref:uncharacterized protein LOC131206745 n=1 Tax=Anopheles bellator TaxID=139047 RepID=UPI0026482A16|nr:uncharacterized protein LOC131206745 [Anopheles bellator]
MDVDRLKCKRCGKYPDGDVVECATKAHIVCVSCTGPSQPPLCLCGARLSDQRRMNPIEQLLQQAKSACRYERSGCTWKFTASEMDAHAGECKFRPYRCIASTLNVLRCEWIGLQHEIEQHLVEGHKELGPVFRFRESTSMVFREALSLGGLKLVDAFSKHFLFHFFSDVEKATLSFIMIYFGRREEADQYCFDFEVRSLPAVTSTTGADSEGTVDPPDGGLVRSVKFVERCYSDAENLTELIEDERCVALSHRQVRNYLHRGKLYFSFRVRRADSARGDRTVSESSTASDPSQAVPATKGKPRPPPLKFTDKGKVRSGGGGVPAAPSGGSSSSSGSRASSAASVKAGDTSGSSVVPSSGVSRSPSSASTITVCSEHPSATGQVVAGVSSNSSSSINRVIVTGHYSPFERPEHSPLMTPSINKHDVVSGGQRGNARGRAGRGGGRGGGGRGSWKPPPAWAVSHTTHHSTTQQRTEYLRMYSQDAVQQQPNRKRVPWADCTQTGSVCKEYTAPYKANDDRGYLMKHPTNCLAKPQQRR